MLVGCHVSLCVSTGALGFSSCLLDLKVRNTAFASNAEVPPIFMLVSIIFDAKGALEYLFLLAFEVMPPRISVFNVFRRA